MSARAALTVLGAGSILPRAGYGCAGYALSTQPGGAITLLDCGPGSVRMLGAVGIELERVERVVLSHFHLDHWLDLFALFFARRNPAARAGPLEIVGPVGLAEKLARAPQALGSHAADARARVREVALGADQRGGLELRDLELRCVANGHAPEALSWRVDWGDGHSLGYSGDTGENPRVAELLAGVELFLCECSFADEQATQHHLTPSSAARLASAAGARRLVLTHFYPALEPAHAQAVAARSFAGPIECARDGSVHALA